MKLEFRILILLICLAICSCRQRESDSIKLTTTKVENLEIRTSSTFDHVEHIRKNSRVGQTDGNQHDPMYFIDFIIQNQLEKPEHIKYLTDRKLLRKLKTEICTENRLVIKDTLLNGKTCEIEIEAAKFMEELHTVKYRKGENPNKYIDLIDGKIPYGGLYGKIDRELKWIHFRLDDKTFDISYKFLPSINEPILCSQSLLPNGIEVYEDEDMVYIYVSGGEAADTYFGKLVFDNSGFATSIMVDYVPLSMYGSFSPKFIGF